MLNLRSENFFIITIKRKIIKITQKMFYLMNMTKNS